MIEERLVKLAQSVLDNLTKLFLVLALICGWISKITLYGYGG